MNKFFIVAFDNEFDLKDAAQEYCDSGFKIFDTFTPYAVHGLDKVIGLKPSRLTKVCFTFAFIGLLIGLYGQYWISAVSWPINIGGKPWNSLPAFVPVAFEITVLFAGLGTVFVLLWRTGVLPGRKPVVFAPRVTDDRFVIVLSQGIDSFKREEAECVAANHHAIEWYEHRETSR